ncbi:hypothetical protein NL676_036467 [Syzygium grande]|nr:hypothetical protein NL676_036467 [Syzygium grande]
MEPQRILEYVDDLAGSKRGGDCLKHVEQETVYASCWDETSVNIIVIWSSDYFAQGAYAGEGIVNSTVSSLGDGGLWIVIWRLNRIVVDELDG